MHNVSSNLKNNVFAISTGGVTTSMTIPDGFYNSTNITTTILNLILVNTALTDMSVSISTSTYLFTISTSSSTEFTFIPNYNGSLLYQLLGFQNLSSYPSGVSITGNSIINLFGDSIFYLSIPQLGQFCSVSNGRNLGTFPLINDQNSANMIYFYANHNYTLKVEFENNIYINPLSFSIIDSNGSPINLNNLAYEFILSVE